MKPGYKIAREMQPTILEWGRSRWLSDPKVNGAEHLVVIDLILVPGGGHDFHKHVDQEEVIYVMSGSVEQWVDKDKRILGPGDSAHIPPDVVHASFNVGEGEARLLAILGPCVGETGYELVDVASEAPWNGLRK